MNGNITQNSKYQAISRISQISEISQQLPSIRPKPLNQNKGSISLRNPYSIQDNYQTESHNDK